MHHFLLFLTCLLFAELSVAQTPPCAVLQRVINGRATGFKEISGEKFEQDGLVTKLRCKVSGIFMDRSYITTATGIAPTYVAETPAQDRMDLAVQTLNHVLDALAPCLQGYVALKEGGTDSGALYYLVPQGAPGQSFILLSAFYDAEKKWYTTTLKVEAREVSVPPGTVVARTYGPAALAKAVPVKDPCAALQLFAGEAANGFSNIIGEALPGGAFRSTVAYPGTDAAVIQMHPDSTRSLQIPLTTAAADPTDFDEVYATTDAMLKGCLTGWKREEADNDIEEATYNNAHYTNAGRSIDLLLQAGKGKKYSLLLEVR